MNEKTYAGQVRRKWACFFGDYEDGEYINIGKNLFRSDDLIENIYSIFLSMMVKHWSTNTPWANENDVFGPYIDGFYLPCAERVILSGQIDLQNDGLPETASLVVPENKNLSLINEKPEDISFMYARKLKKQRIDGHTFLPNSIPYATTLYYNEKGGRQSTTMFVCVMPDGRVLPALNPRVLKNGAHSSVYAVGCQAAAAAINATQDAKYVWLVKTSEDLIGIGHKTPLSLGVSSEHVKSLFYARQAPITDTGRKRPILHWVKSHERRLASGIDIDIEKYLRGITGFEMEGFTFQITQPQKKSSVAIRPKTLSEVWTGK